MANNNSKNKSNNYKKNNNYYKKKNNYSSNENNFEIKKKNLTQKEKNKRKYENRQKTYRDNRKKANNNKNNVSKVINVENFQEKKNIDNNIKEKDNTIVIKKTEKKESKLKKNINEFKSIGVDAYHTVKNKTSDKDIPLGKNKEDKKLRKKRYLKESIVFAIIITFIYLILYIIFDDINLLRLSDIKIFNVISTICVLLVFGYIFSFIIDYIVSELWVKIRRKRLGDTNGNKGSIKEENQPNIKNKEGK